MSEENLKKIISGKVREVYSVGEDALIIVTTDRISAFDVILDNEIPGKGKALNTIASFWFDYTKDVVANHMISTSLDDMPSMFRDNREYYEGRTILVKRLKMLPYEVIVRGYMFGSMWKAYSSNEEFCGSMIHGTYQMSERLEEPIITPSTKATEGHDIYVSKEKMSEDIGEELAQKIFDVSLALYKKCYDYALERNIIIADTKFEFGLDENGELVLADEVFTPDSSRFWNKEEYQVGISPKSFDKQFVRDWLIQNKLDGVTPAPKLPQDVIEKTAALYEECCNKLVHR